MHPARHLLRCAVLGAALFAAQRVLDAPTAPDPQSVRADLRDELLLAAAARDAGLGRGDAVLRETLARRVGFLADAGATADDRLGEALALGLNERDPAVRARLAALYAARVRGAAARAPIDERVLAAWFEARRAHWRRPPTVEGVHVFFGGPAHWERADAALAAITREGLAPDAAARLGDPSFFGSEIAQSDATALASRFGESFARAAFAAPRGVWVGPVASSHGTHLLFVRDRAEARDPSLAEVRSAVEAAWRSEQADAALASALAKLRAAARGERG